MSRISKAIAITAILLICLAGLNIFKDRNVNPDPVTIPGAMLAQTYCSSCHLFPDPSLLNRFAWNKILPQMGLRLGIKNHQGHSYEQSVKSNVLTIPSKPVLNEEQWQQILDYYLKSAPASMPAQKRSIPIEKRMPFFSVSQPTGTFARNQLLATFVKIDTTTKPARIFIANGWDNKLFLFSNKMKLMDSVSTTGPVVDMSFSNGKWLICTIGTQLGANDDKAGHVTAMLINAGGKMKWKDRPLFDSLARPVEILPADLNGDHKLDYLICEFGNIEGMLEWMENMGNGKFEKHIISRSPGAIKAYIEYHAKSKYPEIWVLFTQGQERISQFTNKGNGTFEEKAILKFPPSYGSSSFEHIDINGDGYKDIVYTCGDNGDATAILKPYHGVYVFFNDGRENYRQIFFYPVNGCYKAIARDFDGDGNIDIATVSVYTDSRQPNEGFVYFKNEGGFHFRPYSLPGEIKFERGVTLDAGDLNANGRTDLIIGNAFFDFGPFGYQKNEPLFYVLTNKTK